MALSLPEEKAGNRGPRAYWILIILSGVGALILYLYISRQGSREPCGVYIEGLGLT